MLQHWNEEMKIFLIFSMCKDSQRTSSRDTVHLREDRRHIKDEDVIALKKKKLFASKPRDGSHKRNERFCHRFYLNHVVLFLKGEKNWQWRRLRCKKSNGLSGLFCQIF